MRGQRKNPRKAVQPFENKKRKIDIFKNYEANGVEKIQRKLEIFSTLISKKSTPYRLYEAPFVAHLYIHKGWYLLVLPDNFFWLLANRSQGRQDILKLLHHSCRIPRIE